MSSTTPRYAAARCRSMYSCNLRLADLPRPQDDYGGELVKQLAQGT
jgi:hypothetical protein